MKKMSLLKSVFMICCLLATTFCHAQGLIIVVLDGNGGGTGECVGRRMLQLDEASNATINVPRLVLTNLVQNQTIGNLFHLPAGTAPMFWELSHNGTTITTPAIQNFSPYVPQAPNPSYNYYVAAAHTLTISFAHICPTGQFGGVPIGPVMVDYSWRLVDALGNDYPIAQLSAPTDIFSCEAFEETCGYCLRGCLLDPITTLGVTVNACVECHADDIRHQRGNNKGSVQQGAIAKTMISPNPFNDALLLEYQMDREAEVNITIFNAQGQRVAALTSQAAAGMFRQTIDTSHWSDGVYYCKIESKNKSEVLKLIKTNYQK